MEKKKSYQSSVGCLLLLEEKLLLSTSEYNMCVCSLLEFKIK